MSDLVCILIALLCFAATVGFVAACERLMPVETRARP